MARVFCVPSGVALLVGYGALAANPAAIIPFVTRSQVLASIAMQEPYQDLADAIQTNAGTGDARIYFILQDDTGIDAMIIRYLSRNFGAFEIANLQERYDDSADEQTAAEVLQAQLQSDFDYVSIYRLNDYFLQEYSAIFAADTEIAENTVYAVDPTTGLLTACP